MDVANLMLPFRRGSSLMPRLFDMVFLFRYSLTFKILNYEAMGSVTFLPELTTKLNISLRLRDKAQLQTGVRLRHWAEPTVE